MFRHKNWGERKMREPADMCQMWCWPLWTLLFQTEYRASAVFWSGIQWWPYCVINENVANSICSASGCLWLPASKLNFRTTNCHDSPHWLTLVELSWCCDKQSVGLSVLVSAAPLGADNQIFLFSFLLPGTIALLFVLGRPLWWGDGSVICSAICQWS
jgi:hypothetical protein